jgi:hypothetical protein
VNDERRCNCLTYELFLGSTGGAAIFSAAVKEI